MDISIILYFKSEDGAIIFQNPSEAIFIGICRFWVRMMFYILNVHRNIVAVKFQCAVCSPLGHEVFTSCSQSMLIGYMYWFTLMVFFVKHIKITKFLKTPQKTKAINLYFQENGFKRYISIPNNYVVIDIVLGINIVIYIQVDISHISVFIHCVNNTILIVMTSHIVWIVMPLWSADDRSGSTWILIHVVKKFHFSVRVRV